MRLYAAAGIIAACGLFASIMSGCDSPSTRVVLENDYPASSGYVVFDAFWQAVSFPAPIFPGAAADAQDTVAATDNLAYVVIAPGWNGASDGGATPSSFILLESKQGFTVHTNTTLTIPVDDETFAGNCAASSTLSQDEADFLTTRVFAADFAGLSYDAATCTTSVGP